MIKTVGDLLKLLHRYPSATKLSVGHDCDDTAQLSGEVLNAAEGEIVLTLAPLEEQEQPKKTKKTSEPIADALEQCDQILTMCDEVPERGESFAADIAEKVQGVRDWIEANDHVTEKQLSALEGWEAGIARWLKD